MTRPTRRRWVAYTALAILLYGILLLVFAPAQYVAGYVARATNGVITLQQASGTLWHGSGTLTFSTPNRAGPAPMQVEWNVQPWRLIMGSVGADLRLTSPLAEARLNLQLGAHRHTASDVSVVAGVAMITQFYPLAEVMRPGGRLRITAPSLQIDKDGLQGTAELLWENASSGMLPISPAGTYRLRVTAQGRRADVVIETVEGVLQIAARGEWRAMEDGVLKLQGTIATASPQPALEPMLSSLGPPQADGRRAFSYELGLAPVRTAALFPFQ